VPRTRPNRCPDCGEHVSPYAAGCAICGAELDPNRTRHVPISRRIGSAWDAFSVRTDLIVLAIVILVVLSYLAAGRV
jgi:predicted amidophosphoribosyltransferase